MQIKKNTFPKYTSTKTKKEKLSTLEKKFEHELNETQKKELSLVCESLTKLGLLSEKHFAELKKNVHYLFKQLTSKRNERYENYLNQDKFLYAYAYYYLPWNAYKLIKLFLHLNVSELLAEKDKQKEMRLSEEKSVSDKKGGLEKKSELTFLDFGAGPLTIMIALWIAEPKLRARKITWYCSDLSGKALELGEKIFSYLASQNKRNAKNWTIKKLSSSFGEKLNFKADVYFSANMFNEFLNVNNENFLTETYKATEHIKNYLNDESFALIIEPGNPQGGKILSTIRMEFLDKKFFVLSPCTHCENCPMINAKTTLRQSPKNTFTFAKDKWCHFTFRNSQNIKSLDDISKNVNLEKEAVSLSYLLVSRNQRASIKLEKDFLRVRIVSDIIKLAQNYLGRYACSNLGFLLLKSTNHNSIKGMHSGTIFRISKKAFRGFELDRKSAARLIEI